jgi:glucuronoarabinoxylan endo-1,4-beta-xylanase
MLRKPFLRVAFVYFALMSGTSYGEVNNILSNPGFESPTDGSPWTSRGCTFTTSTSQPHSGSRKGRATDRNATWQGIQQDVFGKMVIGQTYAVSGWLRTGDANTSNVQLTFEQHDDSGTTYIWAASGTASSSGWTKISGSFTLTVNGTLSGLYFYAEGPNPGTTLYLDDANVFGEELGPPPPADPNATGNVNFNVTHQKLEGFGASVAWYEGWLLAVPEPERTNLYNILFRELGLDLYRIRNCYCFDGGYINYTKQIIQAAKTRNPSLKTLASAWTPPAYLKSNNDFNSYPLPGTLKKDTNDSNNSAPYYYVYNAYANWWRDSISAFESNNVHLDYICIQNEADFETTYESCKFLPAETSTYAGFDKAFEAVYQKLNSVFGSNMPKMLPPETMGMNGAGAYIDALIDANHAYGFAHHYYSDGSYDSPDSFIGAMNNFRSQYGYKPLFQTEYERLDPPYDDFTAAMNMARHMHNSLVYEGISSYFHWCLFWEGTSGLVSLPSYGSRNYVVNPTYYTFKHYAKFTDPGWVRSDANNSEPNYLRITAFKDACEPNASIVIINTSTDTDINLMLTLTGYTPQNSGIYQTKSDANFAYIGTFSPSTEVLLPKKSITTIHLWGFADCASVQNWGLGLDSDLNGDCYINFYDLKVITDNWLHDNCSDLNNWCGRADLTMNGNVNFIDFSDFAPQWKRCNNPSDPNCTHNW